MKKLLIILFLLIAVSAFGADVSMQSTCPVNAGRLCVDIDDGLLYIGNGSSVDLVGSSASLALKAPLASPQLTGTPAILNGGSLEFKDVGNDTTVTFGPVGDDTTTLGVTGTIDATGLKVGGVDVRLGNVYTVCASGCDYATLNAAITGIGATQATVVVSESVATTTVSVPATTTVQFTGQGLLTLATGQVATFAAGSNLLASRKQIFSCVPGEHCVAKAEGANWGGVFPEWWGITGTSDQKSINEALYTAKLAELECYKKYHIDDIIQPIHYATLRGCGYTSEIEYEGSGNAIDSADSWASPVYGMTMENFTIYPKTGSSPSTALHLGYIQDWVVCNIRVTKNLVSNTERFDIGFDIGGESLPAFSAYNFFSDIYIKAFHKGFYFNAGSNSNTLINPKIHLTTNDNTTIGIHIASGDNIVINPIIEDFVATALYIASDSNTVIGGRFESNYAGTKIPVVLTAIADNNYIIGLMTGSSYSATTDAGTGNTVMLADGIYQLKSKAAMTLASGGTSNINLIPAGNIGINQASPTAKLHLPAGTATASTAPLKVPTGTLLTTREAYAVEAASDNIYWSDSVPRRHLLTQENFYKAQLIASVYDVVTPTNIKAFWIFDKTGASSTINGRSLTPLTATMRSDPTTAINASTCTPTLSGAAPALTLDDTHLWNTPDSSSLSFVEPAPFSIVVLASPASTASTTVISKRTDNQREYSIHFNAGGQLFFCIEGLAGTNQLCRYYSASLTGDIGYWHSYITTYSGVIDLVNPENELMIYRDGTRLDDTKYTNGTYVGMTDGTSVVGSYAYLNSAVFWPMQGKVSVVLIVAEELNSTQIKRLDYLLRGYAGNDFN